MSTTPSGLPPGVMIVPMYPLYSPRQIRWAAVFGGPLSVAWLMAVNFRRLGAPRKAIATVALAVAALIGLTLIEEHIHIPPGTNIAVVIAMIVIHNAAQGAAWHSHVARQGRVASSWHAFGIIVAMFAATLALIVGTVALGTALKPSYRSGNCTVQLADGATRAEASDLCTELIAIHLLDKDDPATLVISRDHERAVVQIVVKDFVFHDPHVQNAIHAFAASISDTVFHGAPLDLWLADDHLEPKIKLHWEDRPQL